MKVFKFVFLVIAALNILACESTYGVTRGADLTTMPNPACITQALGTVSGISRVEESLTSAYGENLFQWFYDTTDGLSGILTIRVTSKRISFSQDYLFVNRKIPKEEVQRVRRLMAQIENHVESRCIANLSLGFGNGAGMSSARRLKY